MCCLYAHLVVSLRRRSWSEIVADILVATVTPSNKMRVMYRSNLNFARFQKYFQDLLKKGFVKEMNGSDGRLLYKTTERGQILLEILKKGHELFDAETS